MSKEIKQASEKKITGHTKEYDEIRKSADNWPAWKVSTYNNRFAISEHAKKVVKA